MSDSQPTSNALLTVDQAVGMLLRCAGYVLPKEKADKLIEYIQALDRLTHEPQPVASNSLLSTLRDYERGGWVGSALAGKAADEIESLQNALAGATQAIEVLKRTAPEPPDDDMPAQLLDVQAICDERDRLRADFFNLAHRWMNDGREEESAAIGKILGSIDLPAEQLCGCDAPYRDGYECMMPFQVGVKCRRLGEPVE